MAETTPTPTSSWKNEPSTNTNDTDDGNTAGAVEAGIVRGASRSLGQGMKSIGQSMGRLPGIGRLPMNRVAVPRNITFPRRITMPRRLPVKQVARHADRISQGYDIWGSFRESEWKQKVSGLRRFLQSLAKNTVLGLTVFETYTIVIKKATEFESRDHPPQHTSKNVPVAWHIVGGASGGLAHGVAATAMDWVSGLPAALPKPVSIQRVLMHHGFAHSVLFGSYEIAKRLLLGIVDEGEANELSRVEFLGCVAVSGGFAGQLQHVVSHYSEQVLLVSSPSRALWIRPALGPLILAFVPSSVAFVALEYGRDDK